MADFQSLVSELTLDSSDYVSGADDASSASEDLAGSTEEMSNSLFALDSAGVVAGAAIAGIGTGVQGVVDSTQDWRESLGRTTQDLGITQGAANDLAKDISNATFPMDDAVTTIDSLGKQGVSTSEDMKNVAGVMDNIADATGTTATSISDSVGPALKAFGIDIEDAGDHADTFTTVARNTTLSAEDFGGTIQRVAPELQEMGLSIDDAAAYFMALEQQGITGTEAIKVFRQATNGAGGDQEKFNELLGISDTELQTHHQRLDENKGATDRYANAANESITTMDKLGATWDDIKLSLGGLLGPVDALGPALMALGGVTTTLSAINFAAIPSFSGLIASITPLLPILLPIIVAVGALALAWKTDFMGIQDVTANVIGRARELLSGLAETLENVFRRGLEAIQPFIDAFRTGFSALQENIIGPFVSWFGTHIRDNVATVLDEAKQTFNTWADAVRSAISTAREALEPFIAWFNENVRSSINTVLDEAKQTFDTWSEAVRNAITAAREALEPFLAWFDENVRSNINTVLDEAKTTFDVWSDAVSSAITVVRDALEPFVTWFVETFAGKITEYLNRLVELFTWFKDRVMEVWNLIGDDILAIVMFAFDAVKTFIETWIGIITGVFSAFFQLLRGDFSGAFDTIKETVTMALDSIIDFVTEWGGRFIGRIGEIIGGIIDWFVDLAHQLIGGSIIPDMLQDIKDAFVAAFEWLIETIGGFVGDVIQWFTDLGIDLVESVTRTLEDIYTLFTDKLGLVSDKVDEIFGNIRDFVEEILGTIWDVIESTLQSIYDIVETQLNNVLDFFTDTFENIKTEVEDKFQAILDFITDTLQNIYDTAQEKLDSVLDYFDDTLDDILSTVEDILSDVLTEFKNVLSDVIDAISDFGSDAIRKMDDLMSDVLSEVTGAASDFYDAGKSLVTEIVNGIKKSPDKVKKAVKDIVGKARDFLPFSPAKEGPLADLDETGPSFVDEIADGIWSNASTLTSAASDLADVMTPDPDADIPLSSLPAGGSGGQTVINISVDARGSDDPSATERHSRRGVEEALSANF